MTERDVKNKSQFHKAILRGFIICPSLLFCKIIFAGGLVANPNQSAAWIRFPSRNATSCIDAVYFNPAGLTRLRKGFHISLSGQSVIQNLEIENSYSGDGENYKLNSKRYKGSSFELFSPSVYAVYKKDRFALSMGFNSSGGAGNLIYEKGIPSWELNQPDIIPFLPASTGATAYNSDIYSSSGFKLRSLQSNVSFKLNDQISLSAGVRLTYAKSMLRGHIRDIQVFINPGVWSRADLVMNNISAVASNAYTGTSIDRGTTALVTAGVGSLTFAQVQGIYISAARRAELEAALSAFGFPANTLISTADNVFKGVADKYSAAAPLCGDRFFNSVYEGKGITPVLSIDFSPSENINLSIRYEMLTKLKLRNQTTQEEIRSDIQALLALGFECIVSKNLSISSGADYLFDRKGISIQSGLEYHVSKKLITSFGYEYASKGMNEKFQSEPDFGLASHTLGLGGEYSVNKMIKLNIGASCAFFKEDTKTIYHSVFGTGSIIEATETYHKNRLIIAAGLDFSF